jgi:hypothetical protein
MITFRICRSKVGSYMYLADTDAFADQLLAAHKDTVRCRRGNATDDAVRSAYRFTTSMILCWAALTLSMRAFGTAAQCLVIGGRIAGTWRRDISQAESRWCVDGTARA